jgi:hypothetical protein
VFALSERSYDNMFAFAYIYMEAVAAFNVSVDDMLRDEDFRKIRDWQDYVAWKKDYYNGCRCVWCMMTSRARSFGPVRMAELSLHR